MSPALPVEPCLARFAREADREQLADSYLFVGPSRPRLRSLARSCAARLLDTAGDPEGHPDCVVLDPDALEVDGLRVEHLAVRKEGVPSLEDALRFRPAGGGRRAVLLYEADRMGADAQAVLLKTCEEPPAGTVLLLTAADLGPLLPALRSRCRIYRVGPPGREELSARAAAAGLDHASWAVLEAARGSPEAALDLDPGDQEELLGLHEAFQAWVEGQGPAAAWLPLPEGVSAAEQRPRAQQRLAACLGWLARAHPAARGARLQALDRAGRLLAEALEDLGGMVSPRVVLEDLRRSLDGGAFRT